MSRLSRPELTKTNSEKISSSLDKLLELSYKKYTLEQKATLDAMEKISTDSDKFTTQAEFSRAQKALTQLSSDLGTNPAVQKGKYFQKNLLANANIYAQNNEITRALDTIKERVNSHDFQSADINDILSDLDLTKNYIREVGNTQNVKTLNNLLKRVDDQVAFQNDLEKLFVDTDLKAPGIQTKDPALIKILKQGAVEPKNARKELPNLKQNKLNMLYKSRGVTLAAINNRANNLIKANKKIKGSELIDKNLSTLTPELLNKHLQQIESNFAMLDPSTGDYQFATNSNSAKAYKNGGFAGLARAIENVKIDIENGFKVMPDGSTKKIDRSDMKGLVPVDPNDPDGKQKFISDFLGYQEALEYDNLIPGMTINRYTDSDAKQMVASFIESYKYTNDIRFDAEDILNNNKANPFK